VCHSFNPQPCQLSESGLVFGRRLIGGRSVFSQVRR
jgi:hypothetical protein